MRSLTKVISGLKIHVLIAIVAIFAVACGGDNVESAGTTAGSSGSSSTSSSSQSSSSQSSSAAPAAKPKSADNPATVQGAKVDELIMGLISPTRDYFRSWVKGTADQVIKHDPMMEWLFEVSPETNTFGPWLATEYEIASDSMSWNLKLAKARSGILEVVKTTENSMQLTWSTTMPSGAIPIILGEKTTHHRDIKWVCVK